MQLLATVSTAVPFFGLVYKQHVYVRGSPPKGTKMETRGTIGAEAKKSRGAVSQGFLVFVTMVIPYWAPKPYSMYEGPLCYRVVVRP